MVVSPTRLINGHPTRKGKQSTRKSGRSAGRRNNQQESIVEDVPRISNMRGTFGFPDRLRTTLRYHMSIALNSTAGSIAKQTFAWNSCFDPDISGSGHQPLYWDQFTAMYDNYVVVKAWAVMKFVNTSAVPFQIGVVTDDNSTLSTNLDTLCEQNHAKSTLLGPVSSSSSTKIFRPKWDYASILGDNPLSSQSAKAAIGADPAQLSVVCGYGATIDASSNSCYLDVYLYQDVVLTELKTPTAS